MISSGCASQNQDNQFLYTSLGSVSYILICNSPEGFIIPESGGGGLVAISRWGIVVKVESYGSVKTMVGKISMGGSNASA